MDARGENVLGSVLVGAIAGGIIGGGPGAVVFGLGGLLFGAAQEFPEETSLAIRALAESGKDAQPLVCPDDATAFRWAWDAHSTPEQKEAVRKYLAAKQPFKLFGSATLPKASSKAKKNSAKKISTKRRPRRHGFTKLFQAARDASHQIETPPAKKEPLQLNPAPEEAPPPVEAQVKKRGGREEGSRNKKTDLILEMYDKRRAAGDADEQARAHVTGKLAPESKRGIKSIRRSVDAAVNKHRNGGRTTLE